MVIKKDNSSLVIKSKHFLTDQIINSGQVFRYKRYKEGYLLCSGKEIAYLRQDNDTVYIECSDANYFYNYFDLDTDYGKIIEELQKYDFMKEALSVGGGIRILKQQKLETIFSFIISANNNIKRISKIIENICTLGGSYSFNNITYKAFPDINALRAADEDFYIKAGAGYRAAYLKKTADMIYNSFDIESIARMDTKTARAKNL